MPTEIWHTNSAKRASAVEAQQARADTWRALVLIRSFGQAVSTTCHQQSFRHIPRYVYQADHTGSELRGHGQVRHRRLRHSRQLRRALQVDLIQQRQLLWCRPCVQPPAGPFPIPVHTALTSVDAMTSQRTRPKLNITSQEARRGLSRQTSRALHQGIIRSEACLGQQPRHATFT